jgi:cation diffusion facilitator family transporter
VLTRGGRSGNINMRAALLEVITDALGSVAVLVDAAVIALTGWQQADAVASLVIVARIVPRTLKLLRETVSVLLESSPPGLDRDAVRAHMVALPGARRRGGLLLLRRHARRCSTSCRPAWPSASRSASSTPPSSWKWSRTPATSSPRTPDGLGRDADGAALV